MFNKIKAVLSNEKGSTFIESGLWIALVVLVMAGAGVALAGTMKASLVTLAIESVVLMSLLPVMLMSLLLKVM